MNATMKQQVEALAMALIPDPTAEDNEAALLATGSTEDAMLVATNHQAHPATLLLLAHHDSPHVRVAVARNPRTPGCALQCLAVDLFTPVSIALAETLGPDQVELACILARNEDSQVRLALAQNLRAPIEVLAAMIEDESEFVADAAATTVLNEMRRWDDSIRRVAPGPVHGLHMRGFKSGFEAATTGSSETAARDYRRQEEASRLADNSVRTWAVPTARTRKKERDDAHSPDIQARLSVAADVHASENSLRLLAADEETSVRAFVACNPRTPTDVLDELAEDPHPRVRWSVEVARSAREKRT